MSSSTVRDVAPGDTFKFDGLEMRAWGSEVTSGQYLFNVATFPEGWETPWHVHHREDEGIYVVRGVLSLKKGDAPFVELQPGEFIFLPRQVPHGWRAKEAGTQVVGVTTPPDLENFFREQALDFGSEGFDVEKTIEAAGAVDPLERYGLEVLGPLPNE
jgi:quercetin dioxygenase-like cupin family protein